MPTVPQPADKSANGALTGRSSAATWLLVLAFLYTAYFAKDVLIPIALAVLLNLLLAPLVRLMRRRLSIPRPLGALLTVGVLIVAVTAGFLALATPAVDWMNRLPSGIVEIEQKLHQFRAPIGDVQDAARKIDQLAEGQREPRPDDPVSVVIKGPSLTQTLLGQTTAVSLGLLIAAVLLLFLLISGDTLLRQAVSVAPRLRDKRRIVEIVRESEDDISYYLVTISLINAGFGCAIGLAMWLLDVPNAVLWGVMAALLNYIPIVGGIVGVGVITLVSVLTFDSLLAIAAPPLAYVILNGIEGQLITPALLARRLSLNPVAVLMSLIVWTWMWGAAGTLLAVPLLASFKIICDHIEYLKPVGMILGRPAPSPDPD